MHARSIGDPAPGVRSAVVDSQVRFGLNNASRRLAMHHDFAQTIARNLDGRTRVEGSIQHARLRHEFCEGKAHSFLYARRLACGYSLASTLPEDILERLERLLMHLRPAAHLKWSPVYNLHLTLKFIGEWPEEKLPELQTALCSIAPRAPIPAEVKGLGWYPNPHHPRVFWAGVQGGEPLVTLVRDIEARTRAFGDRSG